MEIKIILASIAIFLIFVCFIYELIKDKKNSRKQKSEKKEQIHFFKKINEQLLENSQVNQEILKYLKISTQKYAEEITESQARTVINSIFNNSQNELYNYVLKIIEENHIKGNEKEVCSKIKLFINNRIHKDFLMLKDFKYKEKALSDYPINEWKDYIIDNVIDNVLKQKGQKSLHGILQNSYDSIQYDVLDKILN